MIKVIRLLFFFFFFFFMMEKISKKVRNVYKLMNNDYLFTRNGSIFHIVQCFGEVHFDQIWNVYMIISRTEFVYQLE